MFWYLHFDTINFSHQWIFLFYGNPNIGARKVLKMWRETSSSWTSFGLSKNTSTGGARKVLQIWRETSSSWTSTGGARKVLKIWRETSSSWTSIGLPIKHVHKRYAKSLKNMAVDVQKLDVHRTTDKHVRRRCAKGARKVLKIWRETSSDRTSPGLQKNTSARGTRNVLKIWREASSGSDLCRTSACLLGTY